jgi:hypothetical protein
MVPSKAFQGWRLHRASIPLAEVGKRRLQLKITPHVNGQHTLQPLHLSILLL